MITCTLMGGLGNQLFQLFATMAYAIRHGHDFVFPYTDVLVAGKSRNTYWETFLNSLKQYTTYNSDYRLTNAELANFPEIRCPFHNYQNIPVVGNDNTVCAFANLCHTCSHLCVDHGGSQVQQHEPLT
jgi:hypothetical protein